MSTISAARTVIADPIRQKIRAAFRNDMVSSMHTLLWQAMRAVSAVLPTYDSQGSCHGHASITKLMARWNMRKSRIHAIHRFHTHETPSLKP